MDTISKAQIIYVQYTLKVGSSPSSTPLIISNITMSIAVKILQDIAHTSEDI